MREHCGVGLFVKRKDLAVTERGLILEGYEIKGRQGLMGFLKAIAYKK